ncbi:SppA protein [Pseudothauera nasutitermitis]|uniref:SppA protein n=1 Tax=Pseudothauera nasutitermitis TaxID=2565930 RepID=A0A4S4AQ88_9RHOO|nr:SppA protein [Pseudothauera nasutitermitis]THF61422.1 SppA protein [Pseudothauera nasutitermitis]
MNTMAPHDVKLIEAITRITDTLDADLFFYAGEICREGYERVCDGLDQLGPDKRTNCGLFLNTYGGDPHAAYRLARALGHHYERLILYVHGPCKSAGTLMAIGFNEIVIGDRGELGPMDVQLANREEILEYNSGLDMIQAMDRLHKHAKDAFKDFMKDMRMKEHLSTKFASDTARQLTQGLFSGLYAQMDPVRLGHVQRTMLITEAYGNRLNARTGILRSEKSLRALVYDYPTHDFVIDRSEARNHLFAEGYVRCPDLHEHMVAALLYELHPGSRRDVEFLHLLHTVVTPAALPTADDQAGEAAATPVQEPKAAQHGKRGRQAGNKPVSTLPQE